ncbi:hypothetical protein [uncultured Peptoniphilus sp.]|uniref:hypothetical protein n=1 Tax=uncultured Peptoniphilus sp. TaxID=254354 RepID=UPI0028045AB4|nr:hypothetical protein [uncultured Peptoniphilus sp.]
MKKILILAVSLALLTACGAEKNAGASTNASANIESNKANVSTNAQTNNKKENGEIAGQEANQNASLDIQKAITSKADAFNKYMELHPNSNVNEFSFEANKKKNVVTFEIEGYDAENKYEVNLNAEDLSVIKDKTKRGKTDDTRVIVGAMLEAIDSLVEEAAKDAGADYSLFKASLSFDDGKLELELKFENASGQDIEYTYDVANSKLIEKDA